MIFHQVLTHLTNTERTQLPETRKTECMVCVCVRKYMDLSWSKKSIKSTEYFPYLKIKGMCFESNVFWSQGGEHQVLIKSTCVYIRHFPATLR